MPGIADRIAFFEKGEDAAKKGANASDESNASAGRKGPPSRPLPSCPDPFRPTSLPVQGRAPPKSYRFTSTRDLCRVFERQGATAAVSTAARVYRVETVGGINEEGERVKVKRAENGDGSSGGGGGGGSDEKEVEVEVASVEYDEGSSKVQKLDVKYATVNQLVLCLVTTECIDYEYQSTFFLTHRAFASTVDVLKKLEERFLYLHKKEDKVGMVRVRACLKAWAKDFPHHFDRDSPAYATLMAIVKGMEEKGQVRFVEEVEKTFERQPGVSMFASSPHAAETRQGAYWLNQTSVDKWVGGEGDADGSLRSLLPHMEAEVDGSASSSPAGEKRKAKGILRRGSSFKLSSGPAWDVCLSLSPSAFAEAITLVDHVFYTQIQPEELLDKGWTNKKKEEVAKNTLQAIRWFNGLVAFLIISIVECKQVEKRAARLGWVMEVSQKMRKLHNFNCMYAINGAIGSAAVSRLKHTISLLPSKVAAEMGKLSEFCTADNYKHYRKALHEAVPPLVPYLGVYLQDLTFIEDGNLLWVDSKRVNFKKQRMIAHSLREIVDAQRFSYPFEFAQVTPIMTFLSSFANPLCPDDFDREVYAASLKVEPRGKSLEDLKAMGAA